MPRVLAIALTALLAGVALVGAEEEALKLDYAGLALVEALEDLRSRGLRLVYGSNTVRPHMRVASDPRAQTLRGALEEILAPHGLTVQESSRGILSLVVASDGALVGEVRDVETGKPIAGAEVEVLGLRATRTGDDGSFELDDVPPGRQRVEARKAGYVIASREVGVGAGETRSLVFELDPVSETLDEMTVIPGSVSLLRSDPAPDVLWSRDDVNRLPHLSDDLFRAVSRLPGIASGDFSADFHVRGGERGETLVTIDGLRVYEPYHLKDFQNVFSIFDTNATGSVEVMSGGFTAEYGDRMSGVVEITSVVPVERRTMLGVSFEKLHFLSQGRFREGAAGWLVSARRGYLDLILDSAQADQDDFDLRPIYYDLFAKVRRRVGESGLLSLQVLGAVDKNEFRSDDDDDDLRSSYGNAYAWLTFDSVVAPRLSQVTVLSFGRLDSDRKGESGSNVSDAFELENSSVDRTSVSDDRSTDLAQLRQSWRFEPSDGQLLGAGLELRSLEADYEYDFVNRTSDPVFTDREIVSARRVDLERSGETYGVWLSDRFRLGERLAVEVGARWDRQSYVRAEQWSPRLNVVAQLRPTTALRASWGHYWQSQGIHELQVPDGVTDFHPAQLNRQVTLALDQRLGRRNRLAAQLYAKALRDPRPRFENLYEPIDIFPEGQSDRVLVAPQQGRARGLEVLFERRQERLSWWVTYSLSEVEDRIDGIWVPRSWDQRHALSYSVNLRPKEHWNLNLAGSHHSGWPATDAVLITDPGALVPRLVPTARNSSSYPDYHRIDFRASRVVEAERGRVTLFFEVTNLLDRDNVRSISDFEIVPGRGGGFEIERELERWFPRVPSFGVSWAF